MSSAAPKQVFLNYYNRLNKATNTEVCYATTENQQFTITPTHRLDGTPIWILAVNARSRAVRSVMGGGVFPTKELAMQAIIDAARIEAQEGL